jgi:hypothetical protein
MTDSKTDRSAPATEPEIEITQEMVREGVSVLRSFALYEGKCDSIEEAVVGEILAIASSRYQLRSGD